MDDRIEFDVNDALKHYLSDPLSVSTPEAPSELVDCENDPEAFTPALINSTLNPVVESVAENPEAITRRINFDTIQFLLKCSSIIPASTLSKVLDLLVSSLSAAADVAHADIEAEEQEALAHHKQLLEVYAFLLQWTIAAVETKATEKQASAPARARKGAKAKGKDGAWDASGQLTTAMDVMSKVMKLKLVRIFVTTSERDTFISLFTRPVYLILENEQRIKSTVIKMHAFKALCMAVKHHGHAIAAQTSIVQSLTYFEHLSEPMAEFLQILSEQYDHMQLAEEVLRELSNKEFNANDTKGPKSVSTFIAKLSELAPRLVLKQMTLLARFMDSESYTLRCAIIEVCGNLVAMLSKEQEGERSEQAEAQIDVFCNVLEERFLDLNPYCRCRTIQVIVKLCDLDSKFPPERRQAAAALATRSLEDKSSNVRRNAIKLLAKLVSSHRYAAMHGGLLSHTVWAQGLAEVEEEMNRLQPPKELEENKDGEAAVDTALLDDETRIDSPKKNPTEMTEEEKMAIIEKAQAEAKTADELNILNLKKRYYTDAIEFIETLHAASNTVCQLLSSKNKSEVIEAMDFFVMLDAYKIETARTGIRRMLRLIWTKGNSDEGKGVQAHLIESYKGLFFQAPDTFNLNDAANYVARNMISLTYGATPAELTSLEQLLSVMMKERMVGEMVIQKLWQVYGVQRQTSKTQRRGAIIVLGMLVLADPEIVVKEMETCLRIGLGDHGRQDLNLARYTCIALRRVNHVSKQIVKDAQKAPAVGRLPNDHAVLTRLAGMVELVSDNVEWFGVAEQAIGAIYALSKHPDILCTDIIRRKTKQVFGRKAQPAERDPDAMEVDDDNERPASPSPVVDVHGKPIKSSALLSQLLFTVGHVAIKQIVHLELCEQDFKRRKAQKEGTAGAKTPQKENTPAAKGRRKASTKAEPAEEQDDLDLIGGTTEDDFTEAMAHIRERELLYGETSLLARFGTLVGQICSQPKVYADITLQSQAALCMAKLMCVSSEYCATHLDLLLSILDTSPNATVRSNLVLALGDMAVCFNHLIDEDTGALYRRLNDDDASVKRTCLMTLTFLILAGQVKVKGQLGEMAKCTEDEDVRIRDMSRMFFTELATKDNAVYNHFVDMFSLLSADGEVSEEAFRRIVKFLAGFIEKDKHARQLAAKLAARLQGCENERQWNDVSYVLGLLPHKNEEIQTLVAEGFKLIQAEA
ncbi:hypothetical protein BT63DRAFT_477558 [Microthyrium microscopicum]|uniref:Condensin complex subunit 1 n=1 Tax=Microthyrium microscopicum TaxID=703497 RepID=A0A6A6UFE0_9PEZI|nr:hypothetical protein BT63DRAFT_477558 [Microthyrium microscopicum]